MSLLKTNGQSTAATTTTSSTNNPFYDGNAANNLSAAGWHAPTVSRHRNIAANIRATAADASTSSPSLCDNTPGKTSTQNFSPLTPASASSAPFPYSVPHDAEVSVQDAEHYLQLFRTEHLSNFPFYYIPETKTSAELRQEKPYLWLCIMSVTSTNLQQQLSLSRLVRELASQEILIEGERSLDLLLGLLCVVGWYVFSSSSSSLFDLRN